jgi:hypothetical protein
MGAMNIVPNALPRRRRVLDPGALLPLIMLVTTMYWGIRPWILLVIAVAAAVALLAPPVAGGLAAMTTSPRAGRARLPGPLTSATRRNGPVTSFGHAYQG